MDYNNIADAAASGDDLNQEKKYGFERKLAREGVALLRLRDYLEMGVQMPKNKQHKPSLQCRLTFELLHPEHMIAPEGKDPFPGIITIIVSYAGKKGSYYRNLFNAMNYDGTKSHFAQMLGDAFLGTIHHTETNGVKYANLNDSNRVWTIGAPRVTDVINNVATEVPIPEMHGEPRLFVWENVGTSDKQIKEMWDSIYIDGENNDGESKNWIQKTISSDENIEWAGSRTAEVVNAGIVELPDELTTTQARAPVEDKTTKSVLEDAELAALVALGLA